jgi:hypothetical protein
MSRRPAPLSKSSSGSAPNRLPLALALSTTIFLASCAGSTPPVLERPNLPAAPANFGKPIGLPAPAKGKSVRTFALENRAAAHQANRRLENDRAFYEDVRREFGSQEAGQ